MKKAKEFLENWINDVKNEQQPNDHLEYSEREVVEMLKDYREHEICEICKEPIKIFTGVICKHEDCVRYK